MSQLVTTYCTGLIIHLERYICIYDLYYIYSCIFMLVESFIPSRIIDTSFTYTKMLIMSFETTPMLNIPGFNENL